MNDEDDATLIMLQQRSQLVLGLSVAAHYTKGRDRSGCRLQVVHYSSAMIPRATPMTTPMTMIDVDVDALKIVIES